MGNVAGHGIGLLCFNHPGGVLAVLFQGIAQPTLLAHKPCAAKALRRLRVAQGLRPQPRLVRKRLKRTRQHSWHCRAARFPAERGLGC